MRRGGVTVSPPRKLPVWRDHPTPLALRAIDPPPPGEGKRSSVLHERASLKLPRQHPPLKQRRVLWRRQLWGPAGELFEHVSIRQHAAPAALDFAELLAPGRDR